MSSTVNLGSWYERLSSRQKIEMTLANQVRADADRHVPFLNGKLAGNVSVDHNGDGAVIHYKMKYAHYQYTGKKMAGPKPRYYTGESLQYSKGKHPAAGAKWIDVAKNEHLSDWQNLVKDLIING